ncbi:unnamed protein product [Leuciscus chuanchicus]
MTRSGQRVQWRKAREPSLHRHSQERQRPILALRTAALFLQRDKDVPFHTQDAQPDHNTRRHLSSFREPRTTPPMTASQDITHSVNRLKGKMEITLPVRDD